MPRSLPLKTPVKSLVKAPVLFALAAALLFGASTPFAKLLVAGMDPVLLAGLLYLGSGLGLTLVRAIRDRGLDLPRLPAGEWRWLAGAIAFGGVIAPVLLMYGLATTTASSASLLLNLEAVLTALLAWLWFKENADRRIVFGMALIVAGGIVLSLPSGRAAGLGGSGGAHGLGELAVAGACLCWALDNNLTRKVSASDALFIAGTKGLVAGTVNLAIALVLGRHLPAPVLIGSAMGLGLLSYGISLACFVLALRGLGTARTGAYFSTAPFVGAAIAVLGFHEPTSPAFWAASALMAAGVWLHLTEHHAHEHTHEPLTHAHDHVHDAHHQHAHPDGWDGVEPHTHEHTHAPMTHTHEHYPDIHHRHGHS